MRDDSLSDVMSSEDMRAKPLPDLSDSVGKQENVYAKQIWNDALETAANNLAKWYPDNVSTNAFCAAIRSIRK